MPCGIGQARGYGANIDTSFSYGRRGILCTGDGSFDIVDSAEVCCGEGQPHDISVESGLYNVRKENGDKCVSHNTVIQMGNVKLYAPVLRAFRVYVYNMRGDFE